MNLNASAYIKNRKKLALTQKRVKQILVCVINSYEKIVTEGVIFDYSKRGTYSKEDFLTSELAENYLQNELNLLNINTTDFSFVSHNSEEKYYNEFDKPRPDKIDIQIVDTALKNSLSNREKIYFAIECKRLSTTITDYVSDIEKYIKRPKYKMHRLPFEGQLGFIENARLTHQVIHKKINNNLSKNTDIETIKQLEPIILKERFESSYYSEHKKKDNTPFSIFHLFFDYSNIVLN